MSLANPHLSKFKRAKSSVHMSLSRFGSVRGPSSVSTAMTGNGNDGVMQGRSKKVEGHLGSLNRPRSVSSDFDPTRYSDSGVDALDFNLLSASLHASPQSRSSSDIYGSLSRSAVRLSSDSTVSCPSMRSYRFDFEDTDRGGNDEFDVESLLGVVSVCSSIGELIDGDRDQNQTIFSRLFGSVHVNRLLTKPHYKPSTRLLEGLKTSANHDNMLTKPVEVEFYLLNQEKSVCHSLGMHVRPSRLQQGIYTYQELHSTTQTPSIEKKDTVTTYHAGSDDQYLLEQHQKRYNRTLDFLDQVKACLSPPQFQEFLVLLKMFKGKRISSNAMSESISVLFQNHPQLMHGFSAFLPTDHQQLNSSTESSSSLQDIKSVC
ncbi:hypothetical protein BSLG_005764 [Batrachochytrium salamandrivorans]|nr:hypothetical protein BSLG_005764 [Batrachochytrium salamandrivorans]